MRSRTVVRALTPALFAFLPALAAAQSWTVVEDDRWCEQDSWKARYCEVREARIPADRDFVEIHGGKNGGIRVDGWDEDEILVRARITIWDVPRDEVEDYASEIEIDLVDEITAEGPSRRGDGNWSVSYRVLVPRETNLRLETHNGGITIVDVSGELEFRAKNGGIRLAGISGEVYGTTKNGGLSVLLDGDTWKGEGLDVETKNGGIELEVPEGYSARLVTGTVNGRIISDLPVEVDGRRHHGPRTVRATLGDGGPLIRLVTTNGGISIEES